MVRLTVDTSGSFSTPLTFCFYVSGHGWGHATRAIQIISDLLSMPARHNVHIITTASSFIFQDVIARGAIYRHADIDAGVVQPLPYTIDREQTIRDLTAFLERRPHILATEKAWLQQVRADCVVCDAPFVPCAAAAAAGIPAALATNFTFDEVYLGLREGDVLDKAIDTMVKRIVQDYCHCDLLIRLPGAIRIPSFDDGDALVPATPRDSRFPHRKSMVNGKWQVPWTSVSTVTGTNSSAPRRIVDVPLVFRSSRTPRNQVLRTFGIPDSAKVLLLSFGGQALGSGTWDNALPPGWVCIVCCAPESMTMPPNFYRAPKNAYAPDLTLAADVVLGKLGYGTCSDCVGHGKPFIFVSRPQFVEEVGLRKLMETQGSAVEMLRDDFEHGRWASTIEYASTLPGRCLDPERRVTNDGGLVAARHLEQFVVEWQHAKSASAPVHRTADKNDANHHTLTYPLPSRSFLADQPTTVIVD